MSGDRAGELKGVRKGQRGFQMGDLRQRKYLFALLVLLVVFAGCKGESPTAPTAGGGGGTPGGGTAPPTGPTINVTVSNPNPIAGSSTTITATVTQGGNPVPLGTAVEFHASGGGRFTDTGSATTIVTTNAQGVASAELTSALAGSVTVTIVVNQTAVTTRVTFGSTPVQPPPPNTASTITSIDPTSGPPEGGTLITVRGTNLRGPIRAFFDLGGGVRREAFVVPGSITSTSFQVIAPAVDLGAGQTLDSTLRFFIEAGTPNEQALAAPSPFTFRRAQLTPAITAVSPDSGPISGGTRITIFGSGFDAPVQVSFSADGIAWAQMQVVNVTFNQIIAITPEARSVTPDGSGTLVGPVSLRVININSATEIVKTSVFRYTPKMQITTVRPLLGSALGGTDVTIDGIGFDQPLQVFIGGVAAQVLRVSGTQILARTGALASPCASGSGAIEVINTNNGDRAEADLEFQFIGVDPIITSVTSAGNFVPGSTATVVVQNPGIGPLGSAVIRFTLAGATIVPTPNVITQGTGDVTFTVPIPLTGFNFPTVTCTTASATPGTQLGPLDVTLTFNNVTTGCSDSLDNGFRVNPPLPNTCLAAPTAIVTPPAGCAVAPDVAAAGAVTTNAVITIANAPSARDLVISGIAMGTVTNGSATIAPNTVPMTIPAGANQVFTVTIDPTAAGPVAGTVTFTTNDPTRGSLPVCFQTNGL
jgi:large repetitive protein